MRKPGVSVAILLALVLFSSCSSSTGPSATKTSAPSGIYGIVLEWDHRAQTAPLTPSPLPDGFGTTSSGWIPVGATVRVKIVTGPTAGTVVAHAKADSQGIFRVPLQPGRYKAYVQCGALPCGTKTVTVRPGQLARVVLELP